MRKTPPTQLVLGDFAAPAPPERQAHRRGRPVDRARSERTVELCKHLLDRLDLAAVQQRLREESLAELFAAVERRYAAAPSPGAEADGGESDMREFEQYDAFQATGREGTGDNPPFRLTLRRTG